MASAAFTVNGSAVTGAVAVSASTTVTLALASTTGVRTVAWSIIGNHSSAATNPTITPAGSPSGATAAFPMPSGASQGYLVQCVINGGVDETGQQVTNYTMRAIVGVLNTAASPFVPFVVGEQFERSLTHGIVEALNAFTTAAGGSGDFTGPASSVDSNLVGFNGTGGKTGKDSGVAAADVIKRTGTVAFTGNQSMGSHKLTSVTQGTTAGEAIAYPITNSEIDTAAAIAHTKLASIATDSLLGRDTAGTGTLETIGLNTTLSMDGAGNLRRAALTGDVTASAGSNATTIANDAVTFAKMQNVATDSLIGRDTASTGDPENILLDSATLQMDGSGNLRVPSQLGARGSENVALDLYPSTQSQGALNNSATLTFDVAIASGKRYKIVADAWVDDGAGGTCLFAKALAVVAHQTGGSAVVITNDTTHDNVGSGFTFTAAASTTNVRFSLANSSGTNRTYNLVIGYVVMDKP